MQQPLITGRHFRRKRACNTRTASCATTTCSRSATPSASAWAPPRCRPTAGTACSAAARRLHFYSHGSLRLETEAQRIRDRALNRSAGGFGKLNLTKNLDSSEQFSLGGPYGVRAYANGSSSGDSGWQASLELRYVPMACPRAPSPTRAGSSSANAPGPDESGGCPPPA